MNENVCKLCRRYAGRKEEVPAKGWRCAEEVSMTPSLVIPGHSFCKQDKLRPIGEGMMIPPDWCERPLEQVVLDPKATIEARPDDILIADGNKEAEHRMEYVRDLNKQSRDMKAMARSWWNGVL